jgi:phage terminase small subunit
MQDFAGNCNSEENSELTIKQQQFLSALIAGNAIIVAAKVAGVSERTAHNWLKLPHVLAAYQSAKSIAFDEALEGLRDCTKEAIDTLKSNLKALEPAVQVRAAHIILTQSIQVHKIELLEARIAELEEALKAGRT